MGFSDYRGGLLAGAGFTRASSENFPLMESCDIQAGENDKRLDAVLVELWEAIGNASGSGALGISKIEKTSSDGLVDTYTITLTDGNTSNFSVTNGKNGSGITGISKTEVNGLIDTYTITLGDGTTSTFTVTNGKEGPPGGIGVGISNIEKTAVNGLVDTYTITLSNGDAYTFEVTNGDTTIIDNTGGAYDINDIVDLVLDRLPIAEEVSF